MPDYRDEKRAMARTATILGIDYPRGFDARTRGVGAPAKKLAGLLDAYFGLGHGAEVTKPLIVKCRTFNYEWGKRAEAGARAVAYLAEHIGPQETWGRNRGPLLLDWATRLQQVWMHAQSQPWCGEAVQAAFTFGAGVDLRKEWPTVSWVYTPSIASGIDQGLVATSGRYKLVRVDAHEARLGDVFVADWQRAGETGAYSAADHTGLVRGVDAAGLLTIEGNTPKGAGADQSGLGAGDGIWPRSRPFADVLRVGRIAPRNP